MPGGIGPGQRDARLENVLESYFVAMTHTTLIQASELLAHLTDPDWIVFDVRHDLFSPRTGIDAWCAGHIPGAHFLPLDEALSGAKTGHNGRHPLPERASLVAILAGMGVGRNSQVVVCDDHGGMFAARLWWLLRWLGHANVAVLDGGIRAWVQAGGTLDRNPPATRAWGDLTDRPSLVGTVTAQHILSNLHSRNLLVVDARSADRFRGENENLDPVAGHIPGACNRPIARNLDEQGRFRSAKELREEFEAILGDIPMDRVVMQCGSGVTACHNLLALEIAGLPGASLYPGSWSEWCADPARPVERTAG